MGWASDPRFVEQPLDIANADYGRVVADAKLAMPVYPRSHDGLERAHFPNGLIEAVCSSRQQGNGSVDIERALARNCFFPQRLHCV
jgi:hypothetical protein